MTLVRWGRVFDLASGDPADLEARAGVFVVWVRVGRTWRVLGVDEGEDVREAASVHPDRTAWERRGALLYSATYTHSMRQAGRSALVEAIRGACRS